MQKTTTNMSTKIVSGFNRFSSGKAAYTHMLAHSHSHTYEGYDT